MCRSTAAVIAMDGMYAGNAGAIANPGRRRSGETNPDPNSKLTYTDLTFFSVFKLLSVDARLSTVPKGAPL